MAYKLLINIIEKDIYLILKKEEKIIKEKKIKTRKRQTEILLAEIEKFLIKQKIKLNNLELIETANQGGGFTSVRIAAVIASALNYALGIKNFKIIKPAYAREPNISF